jgi:hypothetical protein
MLSWSLQALRAGPEASLSGGTDTTCMMLLLLLLLLLSQM